MSDRESTAEGRVLAVDDSPDALHLLSVILKHRGFEVFLADGGVAGLEIARRHSVDAILLDVMMPDMNGLEVCRHLKRAPETASIPVILVTARDDIETRSQGMEIGVADYLTKPLNQEELVRRLRVQIEGRRTFLRLEDAHRRLEAWDLGTGDGSARAPR